MGSGEGDRGRFMDRSVLDGISQERELRTVEMVKR